MNVLKYLENKGIKDNPRIIDVNGQATDFYLQTLLEDYKKKLTKFVNNNKLYKLQNHFY